LGVVGPSLLPVMVSDGFVKTSAALELPESLCEWSRLTVSESDVGRKVDRHSSSNQVMLAETLLGNA